MVTNLNNPLCSVIMSVYNGSAFLKDSILSILNQTFIDFEFIIINDASTDNSEEIINSFNDSRIVYLKNDENLGLAASLNKAIKISKGKYIARMDDDDIALNNRLQKQVDFLTRNPEFGIVGAYAELFSDKTGIRKHASISDELKVRTLFSCQFCHPTVMFQKKNVDGQNIRYNEDFRTAQDYELWSRLVNVTDFYTIPEVLLMYRVHNNQISTSKREIQFNATKKIHSEMLNRMGVNPTANESALHLELASFNFTFNQNKVIEIGNYLKKLIQSNEHTLYFPKVYFSRFISEYYYNILQNSITNKLKRIGLYEKLEFQKHFNPKFRRIKQLLN